MSTHPTFSRRLSDIEAGLTCLTPRSSTPSHAACSVPDDLLAAAGQLSRGAKRPGLGVRLRGALRGGFAGGLVGAWNAAVGRTALLYSPPSTPGKDGGGAAMAGERAGEAMQLGGTAM